MQVLICVASKKFWAWSIVVDIFVHITLFSLPGYNKQLCFPITVTITTVLKILYLLWLLKYMIFTYFLSQNLYVRLWSYTYDCIVKCVRIYVISHFLITVNLTVIGRIVITRFLIQYKASPDFTSNAWLCNENVYTEVGLITWNEYTERWVNIYSAGILWLLILWNSCDSLKSWNGGDMEAPPPQVNEYKITVLVLSIFYSAYFL